MFQEKVLHREELLRPADPLLLYWVLRLHRVLPSRHLHVSYHWELPQDIFSAGVTATVATSQAPWWRRASVAGAVEEMTASYVEVTPAG